MARQFVPLLAAALLAVSTALTPVSPIRASESVIEIGSRNLSLYRDLLNGVAEAPVVTITARLSLPESGEGLPAMVIVHGSGGIGERGVAYRALLNDMGIATLRTDSFGPRGVVTTVGNQRAVTTYSMVADAYAALAFLAAHPRIDPERIGIMGFSKGGSTAFFAAFEPVRAAAGVGDLRFAVHIAFYRACLYDVEMPLTGAPVRELIGAWDNYTGVDGCVAFADRQSQAGADYAAIVYPDAHHGFDSPRPTRQCRRCISVAACDLRFDGAGRVTDKLSGTLLTLKNTKSVLRRCSRRGTTVGANTAAAKEAKRFLQDYLTELFGL